MKLVLCGFKSCGKSTVGKKLAERLSVPFADTDALLERLFSERTGEEKETRSIYKLMGPRGFRNLEAEAVQAIDTDQDLIVATGGGVVLNRDNVSHLRALGPILYLRADPAELFRRMRRRPVLPAFIDPTRPKVSFDQYYRERAALYEDIADMALNTHGLNSPQVVDAILERVLPASTNNQQKAGA